MQQYYQFPTPKGIIRGFFHKPNKKQFPVCLIFHGFTGCNHGTKFSYVQISRRLEQKGIGTLRLDFLGSGESDLYFKDMTFKDELKCAELILKSVLSLKETKEVYLLGHSMGGVIASELAKIYPQDIQKMCLWAPAFNLPNAVEYIKGNVPHAEFYDHNGFEISHEFVSDILSRDFYKDLDIYKNQLLIIHGTKDMTVPFDITKKYLNLFNDCLFEVIEGGNHNFDQLQHIQSVVQMTCDFLINNN